jgi:hypothetical protein
MKIVKDDRWHVQDKSFLDLSTNQKIKDWCTTQFGKQTYCDTGNPNQRGWTCLDDRFHFMQYDDLLLFLLTWSD